MEKRRLIIKVCCTTSGKRYPYRCIACGEGEGARWPTYRGVKQHALEVHGVQHEYKQQRKVTKVSARAYCLIGLLH
jgi:DNA-directed RNA polymerase subunit N (RpoN/RPB10)